MAKGSPVGGCNQGPATRTLTPGRVSEAAYSSRVINSEPLKVAQVN